MSAEETGRYESMVKERGGAALYMAACLGLPRMVNMLLSVGKICRQIIPWVCCNILT